MTTVDTVFIVGAGFSRDLGYPLTSHLLPGIRARLKGIFATEFDEVVKFHHPGWDGRKATLPDVEQLLTELSANEDLLPTIRPDGPFDVQEIRRRRERLLYEIAVWFHEIHKKEAHARNGIIKRFLEKLGLSKNPVIISFNWDYELDRAMYGPGGAFGKLGTRCYGLNHGDISIPCLLKPHGSLNWYPSKLGRHISKDLRVRLWKRRKEEAPMYCFLRWRKPLSRHGRRYIPWIVPPTHWKKFDHPMMQHTWKRCVESLSTAKRVYFLGYSLPPADLHSKYIIRCGFHNQIEGLPIRNGSRAAATGPSKVVVVNPDNVAFRRIEATCGVKGRWIDKTIREWLED